MKSPLFIIFVLIHLSSKQLIKNTIFQIAHFSHGTMQRLLAAALPINSQLIQSLRSEINLNINKFLLCRVGPRIVYQMGNLPCCNQEQREPRPQLKCARKRLPPSEKLTKPLCFIDQVNIIKPISETKQPAKKDMPPQALKPDDQKAGRGPSNYQSIKYLGEGSFGRVVLVEQKESRQRYAMKIINKSKIRQDNVLQCKMIRQMQNHLFFASIRETFQNASNIYIIMEYFPMGDLYFYLRKKEILFTEDMIRNIIAQIVVGLTFLHRKGIVYRELKPENLLVTNQGHLKLTDYGFSKVIDDKPFISTFVGTLEYMAPEALTNQFGQKADVWGIGVLMYELMFKENPLTNQGSCELEQFNSFEDKILKNAIFEKINAKIGHMSLDFRDLLLRILQKNPELRIGLEQMRDHVFFKPIVWSQVQQRTNEPPLKELIQKHDYIKFRDPTLQPSHRKTVTKHTSFCDKYELNLYEFRTSH